jgi:predicted nuclease with TOPRIM domain
MLYGTLDQLQLTKALDLVKSTETENQAVKEELKALQGEKERLQAGTKKAEKTTADLRAQLASEKKTSQAKAQVRFFSFYLLDCT